MSSSSRFKIKFCFSRRLLLAPPPCEATRETEETKRLQEWHCSIPHDLNHYAMWLIDNEDSFYSMPRLNSLRSRLSRNLPTRPGNHEPHCPLVSPEAGRKYTLSKRYSRLNFKMHVPLSKSNARIKRHGRWQLDGLRPLAHFRVPIR